MSIDLPHEAQLLAQTNAAAGGFSDVQQYVVSLILSDERGQIDDRFLRAPDIEAGLIDALDSGPPTQLSRADFQRLRDLVTKSA